MNISRLNARAINDRKTTTIKLNREYSAGDHMSGFGVTLRIGNVDQVNDQKSILLLTDHTKKEWWTIVGNSGSATSEHMFGVIHPVSK